jgi:hypothetical protein
MYEENGNRHTLEYPPIPNNSASFLLLIVEFNSPSRSLKSIGSGSRISEIVPLALSQTFLCKRNIPIVALASSTYFDL